MSPQPPALRCAGPPDRGEAPGVICNLLTVGTRGGILTGLGNGIALGLEEVWCVVSVGELGRRRGTILDHDVSLVSLS